MQKCPARVRRPILPQASPAVLSARAGLTSEFGTGSGDPRLHGRTRAGRCPAGPLHRATLAAAWRPTEDRVRATCGKRVKEELGRLVALG